MAKNKSKKTKRKNADNSRIIVIAFVLAGIFASVNGLLINLASTYLAPTLSIEPWVIYLLTILTFIVGLVLSIYLFTRTNKDQSKDSAQKNREITNGRTGASQEVETIFINREGNSGCIRVVVVISLSFVCIFSLFGAWQNPDARAAILNLFVQINPRTPTATATPTQTRHRIVTPTILPATLEAQSATPTLLADTPTRTFSYTPTPLPTFPPLTPPVRFNQCHSENVRITKPERGTLFGPRESIEIRGAAYPQRGQGFKSDVVLEYLVWDESNLRSADLGVAPGNWEQIETLPWVGSPTRDELLYIWDWSQVIFLTGEHRVWLRLRAPLDSQSASAAMPSAECIPYIFVTR